MAPKNEKKIVFKIFDIFRTYSLFSRVQSNTHSISTGHSPRILTILLCTLENGRGGVQILGLS